MPNPTNTIYKGNPTTFRAMENKRTGRRVLISKGRFDRVDFTRGPMGGLNRRERPGRLAVFDPEKNDHFDNRLERRMQHHG